MASQRWVSMGLVGLGLSLLSSASYGAQRDIPASLRNMGCKSFTVGAMSHPKTAFGFGPADWGTPEKQALIDRINVCADTEEVRDKQAVLQAVDLALPASDIEQVDAKRVELQRQKDERIRVAQQNEIQRKLMMESVSQRIEKLREMNRTYLGTEPEQKTEHEIVEQIRSDLAALDSASASQLQESFRTASILADKPLSQAEIAARQEAAAAYAKERAEQELADQQQIAAKKQHEADINRTIDKIGAVGAIVGQQMFVERHCPMIQPDQDVIESMIQQPNQPQIKMPGQWTAKEVEAGTAMLNMMETNTDLSRGFKAGSPMDIQWKCAIIANTLANTWHIYRYVQN